MSDLLLYFLFCILETARKKAVKQSTDKKKTSTRGTPPTASRKSRRSNIHTHTHTHAHTCAHWCLCAEGRRSRGRKGGALTEKKMKRKTIQGKGKGADNKESWYTSPFPLHRHKKNKINEHTNEVQRRRCLRMACRTNTEKRREARDGNGFAQGAHACLSGCTSLQSC